MKLAVVSPPSGLEAVNRVGLAYHMALAQYLLVDQTYREYYREKHLQGHFIIVDNGAAEKDTPPFDEVVEVAKLVGADEIVMPDVLGQADATVALSSERRPMQLVPPVKRMIVPQGSNWHEWRDCLVRLIAKVPSASIGVPKYLEGWEGGREHALHLLNMHFVLDHFQIHFLGSYNAPKDDLTPKRFPGLYRKVRGIDTGAPIAWAQHNLEVDLAGINKQSLNWDAKVNLKVAERNIRLLNGWAGALGELNRPARNQFGGNYDDNP